MPAASRTNAGPWSRPTEVSCESLGVVVVTVSDPLLQAAGRHRSLFSKLTTTCGSTLMSGNYPSTIGMSCTRSRPAVRLHKAPTWLFSSLVTRASTSTVSTSPCCTGCTAGFNDVASTPEFRAEHGSPGGGGGRVWAFRADAAMGDLAPLGRWPSFRTQPAGVALAAAGTLLVVSHFTSRATTTAVIGDACTGYRLEPRYDDATTVLFPLDAAAGLLGPPCHVHVHAASGPGPPPVCTPLFPRPMAPFWSSVTWRGISC